MACGAPVTSILRILGLNRSTYYRRKQAKKDGNTPIVRKEGVIPGFSYNINNVKVSDLVIQKYIMEIKSCDHGQHYGYKKITAVLKRRYCLKINKKKVYRLMSVLRMIQKSKEPVTRYKRVCKNHLVKQSNQLWEMDTKYVYIAGTREVAYLASIIDVFDRSIIACKLSPSANAEAAQEVLLIALYNRSIKDAVDGLTVRTDNGSQFIAHDFEKLCIKEKVIHERIPVHSQNYNAHIESYHRYLQDECLAGKIFNSLEEAEAIIDKYVYGYNTIRVHSSIDYRTYDEFYNLKNCKFKDDLVISI
nr:IS3 family transposase [Clostridium sp. UBA2485]